MKTRPIIHLFFLGLSMMLFACKGSKTAAIDLQEKPIEPCITLNRFQAKGAVFSSPVVTREGNTVIASHDKSIYFFDPAGNLIKQYPTKGWVHATPVQISTGEVVIGSYDGNVYFFDPMGELTRIIRPPGYIFTNVVELPGQRLVFGTNKKHVDLL